MSELSKLLAEFQAGSPVAKFDSEGQAGGSRKYGYASYNAVIECLKPLAAKGMSWSHAVGGQWHGPDDYELTVTTTLRLKDEQISTSISHPLPPNIQQAGSVITYLKRYQLVALTGMAADEDDDGSAAMPDGSKAAAKPRAVAPPRQPKADAPVADAPPADSDKSILTLALAEIRKCSTSIKRQELLARVNARLKQKKMTEAEYLTFAKQMITYITDGDEVSTNIGSLFHEAHEAKAISDASMRTLTQAIDLRITQIEKMREIGGTVKQGV
jgi:hypothetical protein